MRFSVVSVAEAELGALVHNCQMGMIIQQTLANLGYPRRKTPIHCDKATAVGFADNTVKIQPSQSMEMRLFGVGDKVAIEIYELRWHPGQENLADYQSKHHVGSHHATILAHTKIH